jgi:hypothetical protein
MTEKALDVFTKSITGSLMKRPHSVRLTRLVPQDHESCELPWG